MILVVMGVAGSGKSTLGRALAKALGWMFIEADDFHPPGNVEKMRWGVALDDADRLPWLDVLNRKLRDHTQQQQSAVLACSALKRSYRERLSDGIDELRFVYLGGDAGLIRERLRARQGHFMAPELLDSQLATLEPPEDVLMVPIDLTTEQQVATVLQAVQT